ncbi:MAG: recombinase family protein [Candidatus Desulforudis sp.]|nr:recombinase family protein [Desulforudis sp.]
MTAIVYVRQAKPSGDLLSVESQIAQCTDYATQIGCTEIEVFTDEGMTGWTLDRPGLQAALSRFQKGDVDYFIFLHLECLAKRLRDQMLLIKTIEDLGVRVAAVRTPIPHPVSLICLPETHQSGYKIN